MLESLNAFFQSVVLLVFPATFLTVAVIIALVGSRKLEMEKGRKVLFGLVGLLFAGGVIPLAITNALLGRARNDRFMAVLDRHASPPASPRESPRVPAPAAPAGRPVAAPAVPPAAASSRPPLMSVDVTAAGTTVAVFDPSVVERLRRIVGSAEAVAAHHSHPVRPLHLRFAGTPGAWFLGHDSDRPDEYWLDFDTQRTAGYRQFCSPEMSRWLADLGLYCPPPREELRRRGAIHPLDAAFMGVFLGVAGVLLVLLLMKRKGLIASNTFAVLAAGTFAAMFFGQFVVLAPLERLLDAERDRHLARYRELLARQPASIASLRIDAPDRHLTLRGSAIEELLAILGGKGAPTRPLSAIGVDSFVLSAEGAIETYAVSRGPRAHEYTIELWDSPDQRTSLVSGLHRFVSPELTAWLCRQGLACPVPGSVGPGRAPGSPAAR